MKEPRIRVGILTATRIAFNLPTYYLMWGNYCNGVVTVHKVVQGEQVVTYDQGQILWDGRHYDELRFEPVQEETDAFELHDVTIGINFHWERKEDQHFQGTLKFIIEDEKLTAVNLVRAEDYLTSVISSEMSATASPELLKAHAVISRSWLMASLSPGPSPVGRGERAGGMQQEGCSQDAFPVEKGKDNPIREKRCYETADKFNYNVLKANQTRLKKEPTEAEKIIWERLRANQTGTKFRRQHIIDNYIADFVSLEKKLIIELDGEYHNTPEQIEKDQERTQHLVSLGYRLLRFTNDEVITQPDTVIAKIKAQLSNPARPPLPTGETSLKRPSWCAAPARSPLPTGEGPGERLLWYERDAHTHFDVCADDHCQRYQGITRASTDRVRQAIAATRGQVLTYGGRICDARFSKCCGGAFEEFRYCWADERHPYLAFGLDEIETINSQLSTLNLTNEAEADRWIRTSPEAFCNTADREILVQVLNDYDREATDFYRWRVEYTQEELARLVRERSGTDYGQIIDLVPVARGTSGRLWKLKIVGTRQTMVIGKELEIRRTLSPTHLRSSAFVVDKEEISAEGVPGRFVLTGAGWGHGVGLCQIGAAVMGERGYRYDEILRHYYKGAEIETRYE